MLNKITKISTGVALAGLTVLGLSACAPATETESSSVVVEKETNSQSGTSVIAPVTASIADLEAAAANGEEIDVTKGSVLYLDDIEGEDLNNWTGTSSDDSIVSFSKGSPEANGVAGSASVFQANKVGTADVTLTNSVTGQTITFTINVI